MTTELGRFTSPDPTGSMPVTPSADATQIEIINKRMLTVPTRDFMYPGVNMLLACALEYGDTPVIWTEGMPDQQRWKVDSSGIAERFHGCYISEDKVPDLDRVVIDFPDVKHIVTVDDKLAKLHGAHNRLLELQKERSQPDSTFRYVWNRQDPKTKDDPVEETLQQFRNQQKPLEVYSVEELVRLLYAAGEPAAPRLLILDFDRNLFNTEKWYAEVQRT